MAPFRDFACKFARCTWLVGAVLLAAPALRAHAPHDVINEVGISPTFEVDRTLFASVTLTDHTLFARSLDGGVSWQVYGLPMMATGVLVTFAFSPAFATDGIAFAANDTTGVWRTSDHGDTWTTVNTGLASLSASGLAVSPTFRVDGIVLAATGAGCARSVDGGLTWSPANTGVTEPMLNAVAFAPAGSPQPTAFLAGKTVFRSDDAGQSWHALITYPFKIETLAVSPGFATDATLALAFGRFGGGVRASTDGGTSFQTANTGLTDLFVMELSIADDGTTFAATKSGNCFRAPSPKGGWVSKADGFEDPSPLTEFHDTEAVTSPQYSVDHTVFVAGYEGLYRSSSGAEAWRQANVYSQDVNRHLAFSPTFSTDHLLFTANYGGGVFLYRHDPLGTFKARLLPAPQWQARANTLSTLFSAALAVSPAFATDQTLFYAYSDLRRSSDAGLHWTLLPKPAGVSIVRGIGLSPDFATSRSAILGSAKQGIYRSTDAGDSWLPITGGLPPDLTSQAIVFSPQCAADHTVFLATIEAGVWRSTDGGDSWVHASSGIAVPWVRALAVTTDPSGQLLLFAGTVNDGVFVSTDRGDTWMPRNGGMPLDVPLIIEAITCSPDFQDDETVFVATQDQKVFRSHHSGYYWQSASDGMPAQMALRTLEISPDFASDRTLVAGAYDWVWITRDAGENWQRLPGWIRADENHPSVFHDSEGSWALKASELDNGNAYRQSDGPGAWEEYEFSGKRIEWYANRDADAGIASVSIDGVSAGSVDLWSHVPKFQELVFSRNFPVVGPHVIRITNSGLKNPASSDTLVESDGYVVQF